MPEARPAGEAVRALARWRTRPPADERARIAAAATRILILKPHDQLGDFVLITPALRALRAAYPRARIALVTREFLAPLARRVPDLDQVWSLPRVAGPGALLATLAVARGVAGFRPDVAFVMNSVSRSKSADALAVLSRARLVVGRSRVFAGPVPDGAPDDPGSRASSEISRDPIYDIDVEVGSRSLHQSERLLDLVRWCAPPVTLQTRLVLSDAERAAGRALIEDVLRAVPGEPSAPRVGFHPGAANELKCWPLESFVELGLALGAPRAGLSRPRIVVFDSPRERGRAAAVVAGLGARGVAAGLVPAGAIESFAAACAALDLLACNDSGVSHIAGALGARTVSFHSLGDPREWAPRSDRSVAFYAPHGIAAIPVAGAAEAILDLLAEALEGEG